MVDDKSSVLHHLIDDKSSVLHQGMNDTISNSKLLFMLSCKLYRSSLSLSNATASASAVLAERNIKDHCQKSQSVYSSTPYLLHQQQI
ncbi:hypothetical protein DKX38_018935 [Salix brachista]|uniref:Uncharacterized protein n=1 Tax=Salix brachista TaxID=2182728 RepID=A0A5N5KPD4_9ROSI|nr:hypothetical protein DKX38_018935 [Salix brachista]